MEKYILDGNILTDLEFPETPAYQAIIEKLESLPDGCRVYFSIHDGSPSPKTMK